MEEGGLQHLEGRGEVFFAVLFSGGREHLTGAGHHGHALAEGFRRSPMPRRTSLKARFTVNTGMLEVFVEGAGSGVLELEGEGPGLGDLFDELFLGDVGELGEA